MKSSFQEIARVAKIQIDATNRTLVKSTIDLMNHAYFRRIHTLYPMNIHELLYNVLTMLKLFLVQTKDSSDTEDLSVLQFRNFKKNYLTLLSNTNHTSLIVPPSLQDSTITLPLQPPVTYTLFLFPTKKQPLPDILKWKSSALKKAGATENERERKSLGGARVPQISGSGQLQQRSILRGACFPDAGRRSFSRGLSTGDRVDSQWIDFGERDSGEELEGLCEERDGFDGLNWFLLWILADS